MRAASLCVASAFSIVLSLVTAGCSREVTAPSDTGPISLSVVSGDGQSGIVGTQLTQPLIVKVTANGFPRPLQVLNFKVVSGNGSVFGGTELTDLRGMAQELWTLGAKAGAPQRVEVRAVDPATGAAQVFATFTATALPAAAATLAVSGLPNPANGGISSSLTVTAQDAFGNTATGYRGTVHFSSTDPLSVLPANHSFVAGDGGVYAAAVTLKTAGTQTVTGTDVATGSITGSQTVVVATPPVITSFTAAATTITSGTSTALTAVFTGGTATIDNRVGPVISGAAVSTGILTSTTTFLLTVTNVVGATVTAAVTVTVAPPVPTIVSFTAEQPIVGYRGSTILRGVFTGGTGVIDACGPRLSGEACPVGPLIATTTFRLTVTGAGGATATAPVTVEVVLPPLPIIQSFTAAAATILTGTSTTLTAVFTGGYGVIDHGIGLVNSGTPVSTGPLAATTTYTLTANNGADGTTSATVTVEVAPSPGPFTGVWDLTPPVSAACTGIGSGLVSSITVDQVTTSVPSPGQLSEVLQLRVSFFTLFPSFTSILDEATGNFSGSDSFSGSAGNFTAAGFLAINGAFTGSDGFTASVELTDFTIVGNVGVVQVNLQCGPVSTTVTGTRPSS